MNTELAPIEQESTLSPASERQHLAPPAPVSHLAPVPAPSHAPMLFSQSPLTPTSFSEVREFATLAVKSGLLSDAITTPEAAFVIIATGLELGLSPMQSLRGIHVVEGKPILSADLLVALAKRSPDCVYFRLVESSYERATYETLRKGDPKPTSLTWTLEDARRAELVGKRTWKAHPAAMLRARCAAALARAVYPDLLLGVYEDSEGEEIKESKQGNRFSNKFQKQRPPQSNEEVEVLRPVPQKRPLREQLLSDIYNAQDSTKLRYIVKTASGAKKAGALLEEEFAEIVSAAKAKHVELTVPLLEKEGLPGDPQHTDLEGEEDPQAPF